MEILLLVLEKIFKLQIFPSLNIIKNLSEYKNELYNFKDNNNARLLPLSGGTRGTISKL